jgi:hypothetical protein
MVPLVVIRSYPLFRQSLRPKHLAMGSIAVLENNAQSWLAKRPALLDLRNPNKKKAHLFSNDFLSLTTTDPKVRSTILTRLSNEKATFAGVIGSRALDENTPLAAHKLRDYFNADRCLCSSTQAMTRILAYLGCYPKKRRCRV